MTSVMSLWDRQSFVFESAGRFPNNNIITMVDEGRLVALLSELGGTGKHSFTFYINQSLSVDHHAREPKLHSINNSYYSYGCSRCSSNFYFLEKEDGCFIYKTF